MLHSIGTTSFVLYITYGILWLFRFNVALPVTGVLVELCRGHEAHVLTGVVVVALCVIAPLHYIASMMYMYELLALAQFASLIFLQDERFFLMLIHNVVAVLIAMCT